MTDTQTPDLHPDCQRCWNLRRTRNGNSCVIYTELRPEAWVRDGVCMGRRVRE